VNTWKVILATMVIFASGVLTGGVLVKRLAPPAAPPPASPQWRFEVMRRMVTELNLTPDQRHRIERHLREAQLRTQEILEILGPDMASEMTRLRGRISDELHPDQRRRFDQLLKEGPRRLGNRQPPRGQFPDAPGRNPSPPDARPLPPREGGPVNPGAPRRLPAEPRRPAQPSSSER
jgi:hypothetical protein